MTSDTGMPPAAAAQDTSEVIRKIGQLTRMLRNSMQELGLAQDIARVAEAIPDARNRLTYVAQMTAQAAERALNAVDRAQPLQEALGQDAARLNAAWQAWAASGGAVDAALAQSTREFLAGVPELAERTNHELVEIMMAQDFQDLTGQVIKKMMDVIRKVEHELMLVLVDSVADSGDRSQLQRRVAESMVAEPERASEVTVHGPAVDAQAPDVVGSQDEVDDLLSELGF